ncbi:2-dehydro-3-deoxygalactonokinase [Oceanicola sp. 22II-s10i]|uniref:2-dehydro-3-deoxygalactonokinase n=1 Tax=Oceanicola sp. 22II-s10i TaxID=1317116 RepID=UPI000B524790|nr:2-dehydro-3-deoxygalactonokinase [Oceanicola sp. 22II-s10i]
MDWTGICGTDDGLTGWSFDGSAVRARLDAEASRAAPGQVPSDRLLIAGAADAPSEAIPAKLTPDALHQAPGGLVLTALQQAKPLHRLNGARLKAIGFAALNPDWDGTICLPGAVTHWISLSAAEVVFLQSALTMTLAASLGAAEAVADADALSDSLSRPERLAATLGSAAVAERRDVALGALIGAELASARALWLGQQVAVVGDGTAATAYRKGLEAQGVPVLQVRGDQAAEKGMLALGTKFGLTR